MKYLNLGCGNHYSTKSEWTNVDFTSKSKDVIGHNLLSGVPFENNKFDFVYHSHVLEHFTKEDGDTFINECFRVLKPGGIIRIAVPDLERIVREYLKFLEEGVKSPDNEENRANYEWMMLEFYDQTVRNQSGGAMLSYLANEKIINAEFVDARIGEEGKSIREFLRLPANRAAQGAKNSPQQTNNSGIKSKIVNRVKTYFLNRWNVDLTANEIGRFRLGGEIHQWMYDRYSLTNLLKSKGAKNIHVRDAFTSYITDWISYELDGKNNVVRKPDSLFVEAIKP